MSPSGGSGGGALSATETPGDSRKLWHEAITVAGEASGVFDEAVVARDGAAGVLGDAAAFSARRRRSR
jgi:hypothetical protein